VTKQVKLSIIKLSIIKLYLIKLYLMKNKKLLKGWMLIKETQDVYELKVSTRKEE